jgi:hypothetical protein
VGQINLNETSGLQDYSYATSGATSDAIVAAILGLVQAALA